MTCVLVERLLQRSCAIHTRVMVEGQSPLVSAKKMTTGLVSQLSTALTFAGGGTLARHWKLVPGGTPINSGAVVSTNTINCAQEARLLQSSVAVHVRR